MVYPLENVAVDHTVCSSEMTSVSVVDVSKSIGTGFYEITIKPKVFDYFFKTRPHLTSPPG